MERQDTRGSNYVSFAETISLEPPASKANGIVSVPHHNAGNNVAVWGNQPNPFGICPSSGCPDAAAPFNNAAAESRIPEREVLKLLERLQNSLQAARDPKKSDKEHYEAIVKARLALMQLTDSGNLTCLPEDLRNPNALQKESEKLAGTYLNSLWKNAVGGRSPEERYNALNALNSAIIDAQNTRILDRNSSLGAIGATTSTYNSTMTNAATEYKNQLAERYRVAAPDSKERDNLRNTLTNVTNSLIASNPGRRDEYTAFVDNLDNNGPSGKNAALKLA